MKTRYRFFFYAIDNGGKHHAYKIMAKDKPDAIEKGFRLTKKNAAGDINAWECHFVGAC